MTRRIGALLVTLLALAAPAAAEASDATCSEAYESGQRLRKKGALLAASRELALCTRDGCPAALASDCLRWLGEIEAALPSIVIAVVDPEGRDIVDARVSIDEGEADPTLGRAFDVDPGRHRIRVTAPGRGSAEEDVVVREGEKRRVVRITLGSSAPPPRVEPPPRRSQAAPFVLFGVGAAAFVGAGALGAYGLSQRSDLDACKPACDRESVDAANRTFLVSDVLLAVGVVAAGLGAWLFFSDGASAPARTASRAP